MSQILKKFIGADQVDGAKILLDNQQPLRGIKSDASVLDMFQVNAADQIQSGADLLMNGWEIKDAYSVETPLLKGKSVGDKKLTLNSGAGIALESRNGVVEIKNDGSNFADCGIKIYNADNSQSTAFVASGNPDLVSQTYTLPVTGPNITGQVLAVTNAGQLYWADNSSTWLREDLTLTAGDITAHRAQLGYDPTIVTIDAASIILFVDGVMMRYGVDYTLVSADGHYYIDFENSVPPMAEGDVLRVQYQYANIWS